ncbi:MAG: NAD(P)/FAD-dependent oxidoreductase [Devosia sp.]|nr:NAD(P)/FAD-dependent oxidoreductase [Devosia sp.]
MEYDAIVLGAGHNGLAAAVHLASKGWSVAVVEARDVAGGAVKTAELTLPGFRHDLYAMNLSMFAGSPFFARHRDDLVAAGLELVPVANCFANLFRDGTWLGVGTDLERTVQAISALSVDDAAAWRALVARFGVDAPHIFALLGSPMPSLAAAKTLWKAWRQLGSGWLADTARLILSTPRAFLSARFQHPHVQTMMAAWGMHLDFPPDTAGGALFPYLESMANQCFGMAIGRGGADTIIRALVVVLQAKGGELITGTSVTGLEMTGKRATGVRLADGRLIKARRAVVSNIHPTRLFGSIVGPGQVPQRFSEGMARIRPGPGTMMIHLATEALPGWAAGAELKSFAYVHVAPDMTMMTTAFAEASAGLLPREPVLVVGQPTAIDPSRAPDGKHVLWIQVRVVPAEIRGDAAGEIDQTDWDGVKEAYADRVLDLLETYAPGLTRLVIARRVLSPLDLERDNANLIGGDNLAGSHHLDQNFLFRPLAGYSRYNTPIPSLYVCGASTWPGAGTGAGSGFMLAKMLAGE